MVQVGLSNLHQQKLCVDLRMTRGFNALTCSSLKEHCTDSANSPYIPPACPLQHATSSATANMKLLPLSAGPQ